MDADTLTPNQAQFASRLFSREIHALDEAQSIASTNGSPCGVWLRDGWYTVCDCPPDMIEPNPELIGWQFVAIVAPKESR